MIAAAVAIPPAPKHYVTDTANALSTTAQSQVETQLKTFDKKTGDQILVYIGQTTGDEPLEQWTVAAAEQWKAGKKGKDNGAVLFVFMQDRKIRIEVGYGLEDKLTDAESARIIKYAIEPSMQMKDVDDAVEYGVQAMLTAIDPVVAGKIASPPPTSADDDASEQLGKNIFVIVACLFVFFIVLLSIVRRGKKHGDWLDAFMVSGDGGNVDGGSGTYFGGGGGGGGGFSGGGGGFGGGGASGGW